MTNFKFVPQIGMRTNDCYLHGVGAPEDILSNGKIEFIGKDYFILRTNLSHKAIFVKESNYWIIEKNDFY